MKKTGYILLQISAYFILVGGIADIVMASFINSLPQAHLKYLKMDTEAVSIELRNLDHAFMRAIGGCVVAVGVGALTIIYNLSQVKSKQTIAAFLSMVTIAEGINASQMLLIHSLYFIFPLLCVLLAWIGAILWYKGINSQLQ